MMSWIRGECCHGDLEWGGSPHDWSYHRTWWEEGLSSSGKGAMYRHVLIGICTTLTQRGLCCSEGPWTRRWGNWWFTACFWEDLQTFPQPWSSSLWGRREWSHKTMKPWELTSSLQKEMEIDHATKENAHKVLKDKHHLWNLLWWKFTYPLFHPIEEFSWFGSRSTNMRVC